MQPPPTSTGTPTSTAGNSTPLVTPEMFQQMLSQVQGAGSGGANTTNSSGGGSTVGGGGGLMASQMQQAEVMYQSQLEQLQTMGFHNRQANLNGKTHATGWDCWLWERGEDNCLVFFFFFSSCRNWGRCDCGCEQIVTIVRAGTHKINNKKKRRKRICTVLFSWCVNTKLLFVQQSIYIQLLIKRCAL